MKIKTWLSRNTSPLNGKTVAVTGTTGGLGRSICRHLAGLGADLILMDRNAKRSQAFREELTAEFPTVSVECIPIELSDMESVKAACEVLKQKPIDALILNAGAYSVPRFTCTTGYDNVFQINFVSPYYLIREMLPILRARNGRVEVVGSIAHRYAKTDADDVDFAKKKSAALVYGNSKRYLMFSLYELFREETTVALSVVHPGITFTNITAHYPKVIFAIIKYPMKVIFPSTARASLSAVQGLFDACGYREWIGPSCFEVWGLPKKRRLRSVGEEESRAIGARAEEIYRKL